MIYQKNITIINISIKIFLAVMGPNSKIHAIFLSIKSKFTT